MTKRRLIVGLCVILASLAGVGWWQRAPLLAWWHVKQLAQATEANRAACVDRVVALPEHAVPLLLRGLQTGDQDVCTNLEGALVALVKTWKTADARSLSVLEVLRDEFDTFSTEGKASALRTATALLASDEADQPCPVPLIQAAGDLVKAAEPIDALRRQVLYLAGALLDRVPPGQWLDTCRSLALGGLRDANPQIRAAALHLTMREALRTEPDVLAQATPLLSDPEAEVRRAAVLALGAAHELLAEDELLPLLHDADPEVQHLCELALRGRGLQDDHLELARLISDDDPTARLKVVQQLRGLRDIEPGVWLRRLSQDAAPAVRAAAVRAAAAQPRVDLRERLQEMARGDISATVRELATHYLAASPR
jgi:hypothetical protein